MPYPPAITLRPCTLGGSTALESGTQLVLTAEITASRSLKWGATGWQFPSLTRTVTGSEGAELSFSLPVTDLAGWRLNDDSGSIIDVSVPGSYTHTYTVKLRTLSGGRQIDERTIGPFALPTDDLSPIDLDLMLPAPTVAGGVVSVPATWDEKVAAAEAAAIESASSAAGAVLVGGMALPAPTDTDDTTAVQALLDLPGPKRLVGRRGGTYYTTGWTIPSDTTLDMTGCSIKRLATGGSLLRNVAAEGVGARDSNITVIGGDWDHRSNLAVVGNNGLHTLFFHRVDGVRVEGATIRDTPGADGCKYSLYLVDVTRYSAARIHFVDRPSDGVHISGPANLGRIQGLTGYTGDDFVGVTGCDYTAYQATAGGGNITNLVIEDLTLEAASSGVFLLPGKNTAGTMHTVSGVTIRGIRGSALNNVIRINDDAQNPGTIGGYWDDILIEGVTASPGAGYGAPTIHITAEGRALGAAMRNITIRDSVSQSGAAQIVVQPNAAIDSLVIDGITTAAAASMGLIEIKTGATIGSLSISHARAALAAGGSVLKQQGTVSRLSIDDWVTTGSAAATGATLYGQTSDVQVSRCKSVGQLIFVNASTEAPVITADQVVIGTAGYSVVFAGAGTATLLGSSLSMQGSTAAINRAGAVPIRASGGVRADVAKLTPVAGDKVNNTNSGALVCPYAGPVTYDGAAWRADVGYLATGIATLSAGAVTVTPAGVAASITANAQLALELYSLGGTVGQHYISSRVPGVSFTISSTSGTDTSQIRWRLLRA